MIKKHKVLLRLIIFAVLSVGIFSFYLMKEYRAYKEQERLTTQFSFSEYNQFFIDGSYRFDKNKMLITRVILHFQSQYYDEKENKVKSMKFPPNSVEVNIGGKFYKLSDLNLRKIKSLNKFYVVNYDTGNKFTASMTNKKRKRGDADSSFGIDGLICVTFKKDKVVSLRIERVLDNNDFISEIKIDNKVIHLPLTLKELKEKLPWIKYSVKSTNTPKTSLSKMFLFFDKLLGKELKPCTDL
ncbi:hypothetical protein AAEX28_05025 [Lentisphaerota bacterium WC36G]|nr:hypothetical protein LJT99_07880 [Lentisphaerae bacterium WC36]